MATYVAVEAEDASNIYALNTIRGITNIGSHPDNDVVVQDASVLPFHLMIDHRQKPYRVMILNPDAEVRLNGVRLAGNDPKEVGDLNQLQFGRFILRCQPSNNGTPVEQIAVVPVSSLLPPPPPIIPTPGGTLHPTGTPAAPGTVTGTTPGAAEPVAAPLQHAYVKVSTDHLTRSDDVILLELADATVGTNVNQPAAFQLTVVNGGPIVAAFDIEVEGIPGSWVEILPDKLNLYERAREMVVVRITPPRDPSSLANVYPLRIVVTSPNYPGIFGEIRAELTIYPYHEFSVGNLSPRNQHASYTKKSGRVQLPVINYGNSPATFLISAQDEENGCQFTFPIDETQAALVKQAEVKVRPGETVNVPVVITPHKRRILRLQSKQYQYSVSTQSLSDPAAARTVAGGFTSHPLFGLIHVILAIILLMAVAYFTFRPGIYMFDPVDRIIRQGEPAQLRWNLWTFTTGQRILEISEPLQARQRQISIIPSSTISTYTLEVSNWLSSLLGIDNPRKSVTVLAIPNYPEITTFFVSSQDIYRGDEVIIKWDTRNASEVLLTVEGVTTTLKPEEFSGEKTVKINNNTIVSILARNNSGDVTRSEYIKTKDAIAERITFEVSPDTVIKGEAVTINWNVNGIGVESIHISPFEESLPPSGELKFYPEASMEFVMSVKLRGGKPVDPLLRSVGVLAAPVAPVVSFLEVAPESLTGTGPVEISWSVTGVTTNIVLTTNEGQKFEGLPAQGFKSVTISKTTSFILTAYNGKLTDAKVKQVPVNRRKPVAARISKVVTQTGQPLLNPKVGETVNVIVSVLPLNANGVPTEPSVLEYEAVTGTVSVFGPGLSATCEVDLTKSTNCAFYLEKSGAITLKAYYAGDKNYESDESDPFGIYDIAGNNVKIDLFFDNLSLYVDEPTTIKAVVTDPSVLGTVSGKIEIFDATTTSTAYPNGELLCSATKVFEKSCQPISFRKASPPNKRIRVRFSGSTFYEETTVDFTQALVPINPTAPATSQMKPITINPAEFNLVLANLDTVVRVGETFEVGVNTVLQAPVQGVAKDGTIKIAYKNDNNPAHQCIIDLSKNETSCLMTAYPMGNPVPGTSPTSRTLVATYIPGSTPQNYKVLNSPLELVPDQTVNAAPTSVTITSISNSAQDNPFEFGQTARVLVQVSLEPNPNNVAVSSGQVEIDFASSSGTTTISCGQVSATGSVSCLVPLSYLGDTTFTARYIGNGNFAPKNSAPSPMTVLQAQSLIEIIYIDSPNSTSSSQNVAVKINFRLSKKYAGSTLPVSPKGKIVVSAQNQASPLDYEEGPCYTSVDLTTETQISAFGDPINCYYKFRYQGEKRNIKLTFVDDIDSYVDRSESVVKTHKIMRQAVIQFSASPLSTTYGQEVTFTCNVSDIYFLVNPTKSCTVIATPVSPSTNPPQSCYISEVNGNFPPNPKECKINFSFADTYSVEASYEGDSVFAPRISSPLALKVNQADTEVTKITPGTTTFTSGVPFTLTFQVVNLNTLLPPGGNGYVTYISANPAPPACDPEAAPAGLTPVPLITSGNTGEGSRKLTIPNNGNYYIVVYYNSYTGAGSGYDPNFIKSCSQYGPITVNNP